MMVVTCTEAPRVVSPLPTSYSRTSLEVAASYQVLTTSPSFVEVELVLAGPGARSSLLEERNMAAARMCQARPLVKPKLATLILVIAELYAAMSESQLNFDKSENILLSIFKYACSITGDRNTLYCVVRVLHIRSLTIELISPRRVISIK